jgi:hypothetical protein
MYVSGEFQERDSIIRALRVIRENGLSADAVKVYSDVPLELPRSALDRRSHMSLGVVTGAVMFGLLVIGFVYFTQYNYPLVTGGMPIFSFWATGVVFYELTMLGAIISSLIWFLAESGLLQRRKRPPAPTFGPGLICLRVQCGPNQESTIRRALETSGASNCRMEDDL